MLPPPAGVRQSARATTLSDDTRPSRNDNTITVAIEKTGLDAWTQAAQALVNRGFSIEDGDRTTLTLVSEPKFRNNTVYIRIYAKIAGNTVRLTGTYAGVKPDAKPETVQYKGNKKGPDSIGWQEMMDVANQLKGPITYAKQ